MAIHPELIRDAINKDRRVMQTRAAIFRVKHELDQARTALKDLPAWALDDVLAKGEEKLARLRESEAEAVQSAERCFLIEHQARVVERCRAEAEPKLSHCAAMLQSLRSLLKEVAAIEREARANNGSVMAERFDESSIAFFIPQLEYHPSAGRWSLKR